MKSKVQTAEEIMVQVERAIEEGIKHLVFAPDRSEEDRKATATLFENVAREKLVGRRVLVRVDGVDCALVGTYTGVVNVDVDVDGHVSINMGMSVDSLSCDEEALEDGATPNARAGEEKR